MDVSHTLQRAIQRLASSSRDEQAWQALHTQLWPRLFATSYRILRGSRTLAEDATQEALVKLLRHSPFTNFIQDPEAFVSYALAVCRNVSLTYLSRLLSEPEATTDQIDQELGHRSGLGDNPELVIVQLDLLAKFTLELDGRNRELLTLLLDGYTIVEIADRLGISYSACGVRIYRLRNDLSKLLKKWKI